MMLDSGITISHVLETLIGQVRGIGVAGAIERIKREVLNGRTLSSAMAKFPRMFPEHVVKTIEVGEQSGKLAEAMDRIFVDTESNYQLKRKVIPLLEQVSGRSYDEERLCDCLARSAQAEDDLVWVLESAKLRPAPIDAYFGGVYYVGPICSSFRGSQDAVDYYRELREEVAERLQAGLGPVTPDGVMETERYAPWWSRARPASATV